MRRHELTEEQFKKIETLLPGRKGHVGVTARDNKLVFGFTAKYLERFIRRIAGLIWIPRTSRGT